MGIIRKYEKFIRHYLSSQNAAISDLDEFKVLKVGTAEEVNPDIALSTYNHYMEWSVGDYTGYTRVIRQDLTAFWAELHKTKYVRSLVIREPRAICIHDILKDINEYSLLDFKPSDVLNDPLPDGEYTEITINVSPTCFWFTGALKLPLQHKTVIVDGNVITKLPLTHKLNSCVADPTASVADSRFNGSLLTYHVDFVKSTDTLLAILPPSYYSNTPAYGISQADANKLITVLSNEAKLSAVYNSTPNYPSFNLYAAQVAYNGPVEGYYDLNVLGNVAATPNHFGAALHKFNKPRQDLEFVLVIVPNPQYNGILNYEPVFIHYGKPKPETVSRPPVHYWPLHGDRLNHGTAETKPRFLARGDFISREFGGRTALVINQGNAGGSAARYLTAIGASLPTTGDWSLSFDACPNYYKSAIGETLMIAGQNPDGSNSNKATLNVSGLGELAVTFVTAPRLTITYPNNTGRSWPHWTTFTVVRRGDRLSVYKDGLLAVVYHGIDGAFSDFNALITVNANQAPSIKEFRYFDYALDAAQVKEAIVGGLDKPTVPAASLPMPKPKYLWSLDGHTESLGTDKTALAPIFSYRDEVKATDGKQMAYNTITGGSKLGVSLDVSKDFTLSFDVGIYNALNNAGALGDMLSGNGTHKLSFYGTCAYVSNGGAWGAELAVEKLVSNLTNQLLHIAVVRRGDCVSYYINGLYVQSQLWTDKTTTYWDHFGGPVTLDNRLVFRNIAYYESALNEEQLLEDSIDRVGQYVSTGPVDIPPPLHNWVLKENLLNDGTSKLPMTAPFKFVEYAGGKWGTLGGGRTPQAFGPGVEMPRSGDWILDFEIAVTGGPERNALFVSHLNKPWQGYPTLIALYYNKPYEVYAAGSDAHSIAIQNGVPSRIILRSLGGVTTMYIDGVKAVTYPTESKESFKGFRTTDGTDWFPWQMPENGTYMRNIRFWNTGLSKRQFEELLRNNLR